MDEIVFTSGATEANNLALLGVTGARSIRAPQRILLSSIHHKSALSVGRVLEASGFCVSHVRVNREGELDLDDLGAKLLGGALVVSFCLVNSEIGTIQNLADIVPIVRQHGALLHVDAAQAGCAMELSDLADCADLISLSGHKIYGPKGIGALYIKRSVQEHVEPMIHGGGQQRNLRSGTLPTPLCVGFGAACELLASEEAQTERMRIRALRGQFVDGLRELPCTITVNGPATAQHPGNANVRFHGCSADDLLGIMQPHLAASTGSACSSGIPEPSHVLRSMGLSPQEAFESIRFCVGRQTTEADISEAVELIAAALMQVSPAERNRATG